MKKNQKLLIKKIDKVISSSHERLTPEEKESLLEIKQKIINNKIDWIEIIKIFIKIIGIGSNYF